jgi:hypothetical protein
MRLSGRLCLFRRTEAEIGTFVTGAASGPIHIGTVLI